MELRIQPFIKSNYPKKGLLIKGSSPSTWLYQLEILNINLNDVKSFAIPSDVPDIVYGCFIIFESAVPKDIGKNAYFQCIDNKLFIPENTTFYPKIHPEDWENTDAGLMIMHPEFGMVKLSEEIDWLSLLEEPEKADKLIRKPLHGVRVPKETGRYLVHMDDDKIIEALQKSQTEEWMKNLPFDLKKVMAGNKKEVEKYLKYIERYPDRAVELGIPLDIMGASRGDGFEKFRFARTWLEKIFGNSRTGTGARDYRWILWAFWIIIIAGRIIIGLNKDSRESEATVSSGNVMSRDALKNQIPQKLAFESGVTEIDMKIDSLYRTERQQLMNEYSAASSKQAGPGQLTEVEKKIEQYRKKETETRNFLKKLYNNKIAKHIQEKSGDYQRKIRDSIKKSNPKKPVSQGVVKSIWKKKQVLMEDSLGRLYGTLEAADFSPGSGAHKSDGEGSGDLSIEKISLSEIIWLILLIIGSVGLYSYFFRKKALNIGGGNVPGSIKIFLVVILLAMLVYLFYPLIGMFGYNWFVWIIIICVVLLVYRLFSEDKTILKSDKDE